MNPVPILTAALAHRPPDFLEVLRLAPADLPDAARRTLDHSCHMTRVLLERFPEGLELDVLHRNVGTTSYSREIRLLDSKRQEPRLYAAVTIDLDRLPLQVADEVRRATRPLGAILMAQNVSTTVTPTGFFRVTPSHALAAIAGAARVDWFAREVTITCDGAPAITAFEIPLPEAERDGHPR